MWRRVQSCGRRSRKSSSVGTVLRAFVLVCHSCRALFRFFSQPYGDILRHWASVLSELDTYAFLVTYPAFMTPWLLLVPVRTMPISVQSFAGMYTW